MAEPLIAFDDVRAGYGSAVVLDGVSLALPEHGSLAVLGRNGVGKSTLMLTIMGYTQIARGRIAWRGADITRRPPHRRALAGIGWAATLRFSSTVRVVKISRSCATQPMPASARRCGGRRVIFSPRQAMRPRAICV